MRALSVSLWYDQDCPCPGSDDDSWTLYSFSSRYTNFKDPAKLLPPSIGLQRKLDAGTAFILSRYTHGGDCWSIKGEGMQCEWDTTRIAGILLWEYPVRRLRAKTFDERAASARRYLKTYNAWCNGNCYGYTITDEDGEEVDSSAGWLDADDMFDAISTSVGVDDVVEFTGEADGLAAYHSLTPKKRTKHEGLAVVG